MFLGVVRSWLKATMPREASRASVYDGCDCDDEDTELLGEGQPNDPKDGSQWEVLTNETAA